jgi:hypothetical protein
LAVKTVEVATPLAFVVSVSVVAEFAKVPLAPDAGAVKVTVAPLIGEPFLVTVATSGAENAEPTVALWPEPLVIVTVTT